jgi:hypothetical protein
MKSKLKRKYSEEDLRNAWELGAAYGTAEDNILPEAVEAQKEFIQSLKQPKTPKWFVVEMETKANIPSRYNRQPNKNDFLIEKQLKTTTNSEGHTVLCGTYK